MAPLATAYQVARSRKETMKAFVCISLLAPTLALAEIAPQDAFFLLVGPSDKQMDSCPSPIKLRKDSMKTGDFLKATYLKMEVVKEKSAGETHLFKVGGNRIVEIKMISPTEMHWSERGEKNFDGKLCKRAIYTPSSTSQEEIDTMIKEDETMPAVILDQPQDPKHEKAAEKGGAKPQLTFPKKKGK